jgi:hypothetical protein
MVRTLARRFVPLLCVLALAGSACAQQDDAGQEPAATAEAEAEVSLSVSQMPASIEGNVLDIPVELEGFEIVKPGIDKTETTGHFHVFIDREPVEVGEAIPREKGIVHSAENPIRLWGLETGKHEFTVVLGDGGHERIHEDATATFEVDVKGPELKATAPATVSSGEELSIDIESDGIDVVAAAEGDTSGDNGHYHVLVNPAAAPKPGDTILPAEEGKIIHTTESNVKIAGLAAGEYTIYVVMGDANHAVIDPLIGAKLTVTVE